jgi:hypothetical protein
MCLLLLVLAYSLSTWLELTLFAAFAQVENDDFLAIFWGLGPPPPRLRLQGASCARVGQEARGLTSNPV